MTDSLAESQWGLFTSAQAASQGVTKLDLSRLAKNEQIERLAHGVYKSAGVPNDRLESLRAAWLSTSPEKLAEDRLENLEDEVVVSGATATWLHGIGDLVPKPFIFSTLKRRQTQRPEIKYWIRPLAPGSTTIVDGLPTVTADQAIADLVAKRTDMSLVADTYADAFFANKTSNDQLKILIDPYVTRKEIKKRDGAEFLEFLKVLAKVNEESIANQVLSSSIGPLIVRTVQSPEFKELITKSRQINYERLVDVLKVVRQAEFNVDHPLANAIAAVNEISKEATDD